MSEAFDRVVGLGHPARFSRRYPAAIIGIALTFWAIEDAGAGTIRPPLNGRPLRVKGRQAVRERGASASPQQTNAEASPNVCDGPTG
jgi:hypothetical protein